MLFLLEYDRQELELKNLVSFPDSDRQQAYNRLRDLELSQLPQLRQMIETGERPRMQYVVLSAESEEVIRVTHANYFETLEDMTREVAALTQQRTRPYPRHEIEMTIAT